MKGFPKVIKTKSDLVNTFKMAKKGSLKKSDWLEAVVKLENQNWIMCPVINLSEDRKAVTIMFCAEAAAGQRVKNGAVYPTIQSVETVEVDKHTTDTENAATEGQEAVLAPGVFIRLLYGFCQKAVHGCRRRHKCNKKCHCHIAQYLLSIPKYFPALLPLPKLCSLPDSKRGLPIA